MNQLNNMSRQLKSPSTFRIGQSNIPFIPRVPAQNSKVIFITRRNHCNHINICLITECSCCLNSRIPSLIVCICNQNDILSCGSRIPSIILQYTFDCVSMCSRTTTPIIVAIKGLLISTVCRRRPHITTRR